MKKFSIFLMAFLAFATWSCDDNDEELFIDQPQGDLMITSRAAGTYILTFDTKDNLAERLTWSSIEFATPVAITYTVEASADPADFSNAVIVTATSQLSTDLSVEELNDLSAELGLVPFSTASMAFRVVATTADSTMEPITSSAFVISVTPYTTASPRLWVPGNYAASSGYGADWDPADPNTPFLEAVEFGSTEFEGFVFMDVANPMFKFTPEPDWDESYGDVGGGMIELNGGGDIAAPGPGYYYITVNTDPDGDPATNDAVYTISSRVWGIIGNGTAPSNPAEWGDELDMTYDPVARVWTITAGLDAAGEMKFRAQQWSPREFNFGIDENGDPGTLRFDGPNIAIPSTGTFEIILDLSVPRNYTYQLNAI